MSVILIDDGDAGFAAAGWLVSSDPSFGQGDCRYIPAGAITPAVYNFGALGAGSAVVELQWGANANRATNVAWQVKAGAAVLDSGTVNQQEWPASGGAGTFRTVATVNILAGEAITVAIVPGTNGYTVADQCRVTFTPSEPPQPPGSGISLQAVLDKIEADYQAALGAAAEQRQFSIQWANEAVGS